MVWFLYDEAHLGLLFLGWVSFLVGALPRVGCLP